MADRKNVKKRKPSGFEFSSVETQGDDLDPRATQPVPYSNVVENLLAAGKMLDPEKFRTVQPDGPIRTGDAVVFRWRKNISAMEDSGGKAGIVRRYDPVHDRGVPWGVVIDWKPVKGEAALAVVQLFAK